MANRSVFEFGKAGLTRRQVVEKVDKEINRLKEEGYDSILVHMFEGPTVWIEVEDESDSPGYASF